MTVINRIKINKEIYIWAIKESKKDFEEIKDKFKKIEDWISQEIYPTFRQIEDFANFLKVPLGYMFLDKPPKTNIIESEFRTIGNKIPEISKELQDTLYSMGRKRDWLSEYRKEKGWGKLTPSSFADLDKKDFNTVSKLAKEYIDLDEFWYKEYRDNRLAFNYLRERLEDKGITVMQNGVVGSNNHRKLNVEEFRGFLLYDDIAPLIFINSNDSLTGKIFTLVHEYIHFLLQEDDVFTNENLEIENRDEGKINKITAEFLIPASHVEALWNDNKYEIEQIEEFSRLFHVSRLAVTIKLNDMSKVGQQTINKIKQQTETERRDSGLKSDGGGDYYRTSRSRFGNSFIRSVIQGAESGDISYTHAFRLLDNSIKAYDYFKEEIMGYGR